jgi:endoglucanase
MNSKNTDSKKQTLSRMLALLVVMGGLLLAAMPATAQGTGYWHTSGNQILDSNNQPVRIAGINWYGFETTDHVIHGLWAKDYKAILNTIKSNGYNTIRIPLSDEMVQSNPVPTNLSFNNGAPINTDLQGLTSLQILDKIIAAAGTIGLRVILDNHRSEAGNSAEASGLWYTTAFPETTWINDWILLTNRYLNNTTVIGMDLRNEPHNATSGGACWGCGTTTNDWRLAAERAGNAVLAANPHLLIFVEGTDCFNGDCDWWGGNLQGVTQFPVVLNVPNQLVYSAHDYGPTVFQQPWFNSTTTTASLQAQWTKEWAFIHNNNIAPLWLGEFGTGNTAPDVQNTAAGSEGQWFSNLVQFIGARPSMSWTYWALNGEDSLALLDSAYDATPALAAKQQLLATIQFPLGGGTVTPAPAISSITPASAAAGATATIAGTNFSATASANTVMFGTAAATVSAATATSITVTVPNIAAGAVNVTVAVSGKTSNAVSFTVNGVATPTPTITSLAPASGAPATSITISGTNFSTTANANTVNFGAATATVTAATATSLHVTVPGMAAGVVNVTVSVAGKISNAASFTVTGATGTGGVTATPVVNSNSPFFDDQGLKLANTAAITALSITITVQNTGGITFNGQFNTVGSSIVQAHSSTATTITYQFNLATGQTLGAGTGWLFDAQMGGNGTAHPTTGDTFTATYTTGGQTFTQSGHF